MAMNMDALLRIKAAVLGENNIRRLGNSMQGLQGQVKNAALGFNSLKGAVAGFGAAIAGSAVVAGLTAVVRQSINAGDELFNLQAKTGIAAKALIGIGNAAKLADVDMAALGKGLTKLNVNLVKAAEGNEGLARKFEALGVEVKDANGQVAPADKVLGQIANRFADMPDGAQKAAAAVALFGKSGADLIPLLNEGADSMEKFTYKVGEDFAARSDLFSDTITELGIKTQGFGLELTDSLLPALQSILEVFGDLFDTKQDFNALFEVIKFGLRAISTVIFATIKLVDAFIKNAVAAVEVVQKAFSGDLAGAAAAYQNRVGDLLTQARADFAEIQKIWMDSPSPGTGRRTGGRSMALDTSAQDQRAAAAASRAAAADRKAANERERLLERRASLTQRANDLQRELSENLEDVDRKISGVGASSFGKLQLQREQAVSENNRLIDSLTLQVVELAREAQKLGGQLDLAPFKALINSLSEANVALANREYADGLADIGIEARDAAIALTDFGTAAVNQAGVLGGAKQGVASYLESIGTLADSIEGITTNAFKGLEDAIVSLTTTGTFNFRQFALSVIEELTRMVTRMLVIAPLLQFIQSLIPGGPFATAGKNLTGIGALATKIPGFSLNEMGNVFAENGIQKFARGGIVNKPTLFPFAKGVGLMGEAGPEAILPLRRGSDGRLGVSAAGGGSVTVNVQVDASGSSVQGNQPDANALGRVVGAAVQAELIKQKRPGGLLA